MGNSIKKEEGRETAQLAVLLLKGRYEFRSLVPMKRVEQRPCHHSTADTEAGQPQGLLARQLSQSMSSSCTRELHKRGGSLSQPWPLHTTVIQRAWGRAREAETKQGGDPWAEDTGQ